MRRRKFTVLVLRPDYVAENYGTDTFLARVKAATAAMAVDRAAAQAAAADRNEERWRDYCPLITLNGWHADVTPAEASGGSTEAGAA